MCCLLTKIIMICRVAKESSCGKKIISLLKFYNLNKYMTFHSNTAVSLSPWIISEGVLYTFYLLFSKFIPTMVAIILSDVICYNNLLHLKEQGVFIYPKSGVCGLSVQSCVVIKYI